MKPSDIITDVRRLIQDEGTVGNIYRYSDVVLLGYVNQTLKRTLAFRPDLFLVEEEMSTEANTATQTLPAGGVRISEVIQVVGGDAVVECTREILDQTYPGWRSETPGTPSNWMRHPRNPNTFYLYPAPTSGVSILIEYVKTPDDYELYEDIDMPEAYKPAIVDGVVYLVESVDAEHVGNGRAEFFYKSFMDQLGASFQQRVTVDSESGAVGAGAPQRQQGQQNGQ